MPDTKLVSYEELAHDDWTALSDAVLQFEALWQQTSAPSIRPYLRSEGDPLRLRLLIELVRVDQEHRWKRGDRRQVEDYLKDWPELGEQPQALAELLQSECLTRFCLDDPPAAAELSQRFPELFDQVDLEQLRVQAAEERRDGSTEQNEATATFRPARRPEPAGLPHGGASINQRLRSGPRFGRLSGKMFGRYEIRRLVATGGMGVVYEARDTELNRVVALKIPRVDMLQDHTAMQRFANEARAAAAIRHPHVCPIFDVGEFEDQQFLTMPLVEGVSLSAWLEQRTVTERDAVEILRKLASAIQAVHDAGIRHRDIKASNVMIDQRGEPLLMDFGLARVPQTGAQLTHSGSLIGTPAYMAPEQINEGASGGDERSDVYSLGVLLYQLLTGRLPFEGPITRVLVDIATREPPAVQSLRPDVDADLAALCHKAMSRKPADRFQAAKDFEEALADWNRRLGTPARPAFDESVPTHPDQPKPAVHESHSPQGRKSANPTRRVWTAIAAAAFVLLAGIVIRVATDNAELVIVAPEKGVEVSVRQVTSGDKALSLTTGENTVRVRSGEVEVVLTGANADQYEVADNRIVLKRHDRKIVEITRKELVGTRETRTSTGALVPNPQTPTPSTSPSAWDQLDPRLIPLSERMDGQPEELVAVLGDHRQRVWGYVQDAAVSMDGSQFAVLTDTEIHVWHRAASHLPQTFRVTGPSASLQSLTFLADGRLVAGNVHGGRLNATGPIHFFSPTREPGRLTRTATLPEVNWKNCGVRGLCASADGRWLAAALFAAPGDPCGLELWDVSGEEPRLAMQLPIITKKSHQRRHPCFSSDSRWLAFSPGDETVRLVDLRMSPPAEVATLRTPDDAADDEPSRGFHAAGFLPDGRLMTWDGRGRIWRWTTGPEPVRDPVSINTGAEVTQEARLLTATQVPVVVATNYAAFQVWDWSAEKPQARGQLHATGQRTFATDNLQAAAISPDGRTLVTAHLNGAVRFLDIAEMELVERTPLRPNPAIAINFSPRGPIVLDNLVLTTSESNAPELWQIEGGKLVARPAPADGETPLDHLLAASHDGRFLTVRRYNASRSENGLIVFERQGNRFHPVRDIEGRYAHGAMNRDGSRLAVTTVTDNRLRLLALEGTRTRVVAEVATPYRGIQQLAFIDDQRLITRGIREGSTRPVLIWDIQGEMVKFSAELPEDKDTLLHFAVSPDGRTLATGGAFLFRCWDLQASPPAVLAPYADRTTHETLTGQRYRNMGPVAFSPDGRTLAACTVDLEHRYGIDLVDVATRETRRRMIWPGPVRNMQFASDGRHLVTANGNSTVYVVRLNEPSR